MFTSLDLPNQEQRVNQCLRLGLVTEYIRTNSVLEQLSEATARFLPYDFHFWSGFKMTDLSGFLNYFSDFTKRARRRKLEPGASHTTKNGCFNWAACINIGWQ